MYKKEQVVMLHTDEKSKLVLSFREGSFNQLTEQKLTLIEKANYKLSNIQSQHLYITSDDEIKEGDFAIYDNGYNSPGFIVKKVKVSDGIVYRRPNETYEDYGYKDGGITPYNKDNKITKVMVEFESYHSINTSIAEINIISGDNSMNWEGIGDNRDFKLKINLDNTINIKTVKDSWSRDEVIELLQSVVKNISYGDEELLHHYDGEFRELNKWIEENL